MAVTALHTAATGMQALSSKMDVIANNIANAETVGFKSARTNFQDLLYQLRSQPGVQTSDNTAAPMATQIGLGVMLSNTQTLFKQGGAMQTGEPLDVMIQGDGFFQVELPGGGTAYTRAGNFVRNPDGELVLGDNFGHRLKDSPTIPQDVPIGRVSFTSDGSVVVSNDDGTVEPVAQIELARFTNPAGLLQFGSNLFLVSEASGEPILAKAGTEGMGSLSSGFLEESTTEAVSELVELIKAQRVFQMNSQTIQAADETLRTVATLRR